VDYEQGYLIKEKKIEAWCSARFVWVCTLRENTGWLIAGIAPRGNLNYRRVARLLRTALVASDGGVSALLLSAAFSSLGACLSSFRGVN
jgi:hypothetical protein